MKHITVLLASLSILAGCTDTNPIVVDTFRGNPISGNLTGTLPASGSPYLATSALTVPRDETLVIEAGTELRFEPGVALVVSGRINANGNEAAPITFTSGSRNPVRGDWDGVWLESADAGSSFEFCRFLFGAIKCHAQTTEPPWQPRFYSSGSWSSPLPRMDFVSDPDPITGFWGYSNCLEGEPPRGYPYHSGMVAGVNDTCLLIVIIKNSSTTPVSLGSYTPENWFIPVVYYSYTDAQHDRVWKDTTDFNFRFDRWAYNGETIPKPTSLSQNQEVELDYYLWGLPKGNAVLHAKKTSSAPSGFTVKKIGVGQYWYSEPKEVKDTINAYVSILLRAYHRKQLTVAKQWADSVLAKEDSSLAGWDWKATIYGRQKDVTNALASYNRIISIYENNHDPLLDYEDTLKTTEDERYWALDRYNNAIYWRWRLVNNVTNQARE